MSRVVTVKYGNNSIQIETQSMSTISDLMVEIEKLTNIHSRGQKIVHKGKLLFPAQPLTVIPPGGKVMLLISPNMHQGTPGSTSVSSKSCLVERKDAVKRIERNLETTPKEVPRSEKWTATGLVSLQSCNLNIIPEGVWMVGSKVRVLSADQNKINKISCHISLLTNLQKLNLGKNRLTFMGVPWEALSTLEFLHTLHLNDNIISKIPPSIASLKKLKVFDLRNNQLAELPEELGQLGSLEKLDVSHNKLVSIPGTIGNCTNLIEMDLSSNHLHSIPVEVGQLVRLTVLVLNNNKLKTLPPQVLKGCVQLSNLAMYGNPITMDELRKVDGFEEYDGRRRAKYDKQVDFEVIGSSAGFLEGADAEQWKRW